MLILASHAFAVIALTVGATWDLMTTEVPDEISVSVILVGLGAHGALSYLTGSLEPLVWSLGVGTVFSVYGWGMYYTGSWGGADAFALSSLGFAAPYSFSGPGIFYAADLFINIMLLGFIYAVVFAFYRAIRSDGIFSDTLKTMKDEKYRLTGEIALAGLLSVFLGSILVLDTIVYFVSFLTIVLLYRFLLSVEDQIMTSEVKVSDIEVGDVVETENIEMDRVREENLVGILLSRIENVIPLSVLSRLKDRYGYSEIVGVTENEIERIQDSGMEKVSIKSGLRFVPVFPIALFLTDMGFLGLRFLFTLFS